MPRVGLRSSECHSHGQPPRQNLHPAALLALQAMPKEERALSVNTPKGPYSQNPENMPTSTAKPADSITTDSVHGADGNSVRKPAPASGVNIADAAYSVSWGSPNTPGSMAAGSGQTVALSFTNTGSLTWEAGGDNPVRVGYHWYSGACPSNSLSTSVDPARNRRRFYAIIWQPTVWGDTALVRHWGRLGTLGRSLANFYSDIPNAQVAAEGMVRRRLNHGHKLVDFL